MPRYIFKVKNPVDDKNYYGEWSSVVDSPVTKIMSLDKFIDYYRIQYGLGELQGLSMRMSRVEAQGTSCMLGSDIETFMEMNSLNSNGSASSIQKILENYSA